MKFLFFKHRLDDEQEPTTLEMPSRSTTIPTVESLLETNQNDVEELQKKPKKANQRDLLLHYSYFRYLFLFYLLHYHRKPAL